MKLQKYKEKILIFDLTKYDVEDVLDLGLYLIDHDDKFVIMNDFLLLSKDNDIECIEYIGNLLG